jgi:hypothetical protein
MVSRTAVVNGERTEEERSPGGVCPHHWVIDEAAGPVSRGRCQVCGTQKEFNNYLPDCLANKDRETYEGWVAKHSQNERRRARAKRGIVSLLDDE